MEPVNDNNPQKELTEQQLIDLIEQLVGEMGKIIPIEAGEIVEC